MKLGIMQPYFFPYLGYFELILRTDKWVVFDVVQYHTKSWMTRNRILHPVNGWQYINVPVEKAPRDTLICDIRLTDKDAALARILGQIMHYKKHAPYYHEVVKLIERTFNSVNSDRLEDLNTASLIETCKYLNINFNYSICSRLDLDLSYIKHPGQWALQISIQLGADEYINPIGGENIFIKTEWEKEGITLRFLNHLPFKYNCSPYEFIPGLSIIDVLMWSQPEEIIKYIVSDPFSDTKDL